MLIDILEPDPVHGRTPLSHHPDSSQATDDRRESARIVLEECFWGDYRLTPKELLDRLEKQDVAFERFLFSKIVENSRYPSRHLRNLLHPERLHPLLERYLAQAGDKKRVRLVAANLTGRPELAPEYRWRR